MTENRDTVLLVEDDPGLLRMESRMLRRAGFAVLLALDATTALRLFSEHQGKIRCVMLDQTLPDKPGIWLFQQLRALQPDLHVILCSGLPPADIDGYDTAQIEFLPKPFSRAALFHAIDTHQACA